MKHIIEIVMNILESEKRSAEIQLQLNKICKLEDEFTKDLSKEKWHTYINLDNEKAQLHSLEIEHIIEITFKVCKEIFLNKKDNFILASLNASNMKLMPSAVFTNLPVSVLVMCLNALGFVPILLNIG